MLKKFCKDYLLMVIMLILLEVAGVAAIFLGAFKTGALIPTRCFLLIIGIAGSIGAAVIFTILFYEFEKLYMLIELKEELVKDGGVE